jgi:hypothetical protein
MMKIGRRPAMATGRAVAAEVVGAVRHATGARADTASAPRPLSIARRLAYCFAIRVKAKEETVKPNHSLSYSRILIFGATLNVACPLASAAEVDRAARERYLQERAACLSGQSHQPQEVCLREAGAAYAEARRGRLGHEDPDRLAANALARCAVRPAEEKQMCERMARGEGTVTGSVEDGGFVREIRIVVEDAEGSPR